MKQIKYWFLILGLCMVEFLHAQINPRVTAYIEQYKELAMQEMIRTGVPASIKLAQGILESQFGESELAVKANNHFGIKCKTEWTGGRIFKDDDAKNECFRAYDDAASSYQDHSNFLKTRAHYAFLFQLDPTDYQAWAHGLKKAGYATLPTYPQRLIKVIEDYNLQTFTLLAISRSQQSDFAKNESKVVDKQVDTIVSKEEEAVEEANVIEEEPTTKVVEEVKAPELQNMSALSKSNAVEEKKRNYPTGIFVINHARVVYVESGTSLLSVARQHDIAMAKLIEFNDNQLPEILEKDCLVFLEKKLKKGSVESFVADESCSLFDVAQKTGVRLDVLSEINKKQISAQVRVGEKILLRTPSEKSKSVK